MISLRQALTNMRNKDHLGRFVPFSIRFVACDTSRKLGGQFVEYNNLTLPYREQQEMERVERPIQAADGSTKKYAQKTTVQFRTSSGEIKQCHIDLITKFNDQTII